MNPTNHSRCHVGRARYVAQRRTQTTPDWSRKVETTLQEFAGHHCAPTISPPSRSSSVGSPGFNGNVSLLSTTPLMDTPLNGVGADAGVDSWVHSLYYTLRGSTFGDGWQSQVATIPGQSPQPQPSSSTGSGPVHPPSLPSQHTRLRHIPGGC